MPSPVFAENTSFCSAFHLSRDEKRSYRARASTSLRSVPLEHNFLNPKLNSFVLFYQNVVQTKKFCKVSLCPAITIIPSMINN